MKPLIALSGIATIGILAFGLGAPSARAATSSNTSSGVTLSASQPLLRTGQMVTLLANIPHSLAPGQQLAIINETTGQTIGLTATGSSVSATWANNSAVTQDFKAQVTASSKTLPVTWSAQGTGDTRGYANAVGDTVTLNAPLTSSPGSPVTVTANPVGFQHPVFQFWWAKSGGQWLSSGEFKAASSYTFTPPQGLVDVVVYARESSAPAHEDATQRATYQSKSATQAIAIDGGNPPTSITPTISTSNAWVGLQGLNQVSVGDGMRFTANAVGMTNPMYQFWFLSPKNLWESSGHYSLSNTFNMSATMAGKWTVVVYARPESAPSNETVAQRAKTTVKSPSMLVVVHP